MALNLYRKINETIARNCTRFLQNHAQKLAQVNLEDTPQIHNKELEKPNNKFNKFAISSNHRTTPSENPRSWVNCFEPERNMLQRSLQNRYLQPATMPSYIDKPIFDNNFMATLQEGPIKKAQTIVTNNSASQQILESFKKRQAQNLPTRVPKMTSNPFPEPLKAIFSPYTLTDQEKAEQMFQDQQAIQVKQPTNSTTKDFLSNPGTIKPSKKFYCTSSLQGNSPDNVNFSPSIGDPVRYFSSKSGGNTVCEDKTKPKAKSCLPKKCDKITLKGCPPVRKNTICKQKNKEVHCKKVEAPYPSYSESCYMEPRVRKTECDVCPWNEKNNPNFRGKLKRPPQSYHTQCFPSPNSTDASGSIFGKYIKDQNDHKNPAQAWISKANLSHMYCKRMPTMDFIDISKASKLSHSPLIASQNMDIFEDKRIRAPMSTETLKFGYCDRHQTILTEFFTKNQDLLKNFRNGDDLSEFGVKKAKLSKILSSREVFDVVCKKGERIIPDYPKDCDRPYQDTTKTCPSGLTRKKTKKDRLKRKIPKNQSCS
ncbi:uncharacterized protein LOC123320143 isoform X2 [Coccinella septempunctata]|uniref:uncharacterized protein LOC123320143 isoform X2 n=1 Tax=Coccinella septempunctata TaxID=41139 RepID=UPI001D0863E6|nr:uncharacterized protein LOC123320143 isoform X2 [Coccinella septempunctata]